MFLNSAFSFMLPYSQTDFTIIKLPQKKKSEPDQRNFRADRHNPLVSQRTVTPSLGMGNNQNFPDTALMRSWTSYYDYLERITGQLTSIYSSAIRTMKAGTHEKVKYSEMYHINTKISKWSMLFSMKHPHNLLYSSKFVAELWEFQCRSWSAH